MLMDATLEQMKQAEDNFHPKAMSIPGVHATGIGFKEIAGELTDTMAIRIYVTKKKPLSEVPAGERIPEQIGGFPTDVIERPEMTALTDENKYRPIVGGCNIVVGFYSGTCGCIVKDTTDNSVCGLSNQHVLDHYAEFIGQPKGGGCVYGRTKEAQCLNRICGRRDFQSVCRLQRPNRGHWKSRGILHRGAHRRVRAEARRNITLDRRHYRRVLFGNTH